MTDPLTSDHGTGDLPQDMAETVHVPVGGHPYDIVIGEGLIDRLGALVRPHLARAKTVIVSDATVADLYMVRAVKSLEKAGIACGHIILPPGEASKSFAQLEQLTDTLLDHKVERRDCIVALGGGVIGDLAGFASSIVLRGMGFIQVPTTLLAQVDSSVGGKTGINTGHGKNLIGSFHQPRLVVSDLAVLDTLPSRELQAGFAEVVKYGLIGDPAFFAWLEQNAGPVLGGDRAAQRHAVAVSCRAKARIVTEDERESGRRALLNLGHTFGHALEAALGYDGRLLHGEAVAVGCVMASSLAARLGLAHHDECIRVERLFAAAGMKTRAHQLADTFSAGDLLAHMAQDKKVENGRLVLIAGPIGDARILRGVEIDIVAAVLEDSLKHPAA